MSVLVVVAPYALASTVRFIEAAAGLDGATVGLISHETEADVSSRLSADARAGISGFLTVDDAFNPDTLTEAVRSIATQLGGRVDALASILEPLQVPVAMVRERLGIEGMGAETAQRFRGKAVMKDALRSAGLPCAHHRLVQSADEALAFAEQYLPLVVKPPAGAGAVDTFRVDERHQLEGWLSSSPPSAERPLLLEEFVQGEECSFDSVTVGGEHRFASISRYSPSPLEVMATPWIQWTVLMPRSIDGPEFEPIRAAGPAALDALGMTTGISHLEWFRRADGSIAISEVGCRPPGAQMTTLLSYVHDHDFYRTWAELAAFGTFQAPERQYAAGAAYLRGHGAGEVSALDGVDELQAELGHLVVEARLPSHGQGQSSSYEGQGYVIVRHPETEVVADALNQIISRLRVHLDVR